MIVGVIAEPVEANFELPVPCRRGDVRGGGLPRCDGIIEVAPGGAFPKTGRCSKCGMPHGFLDKSGLIVYGPFL